MLVLVVVVNVYFASVFVSAVPLVEVPRRVPAALFRFNFARGNIVPEFDVFLSQSVKVIVEPAVIVPGALGTPLCVSNALIKYSPADRFFKFADCTARLVASGPAVFSWKRFAVLEASRCK